MTRAKTKKTTPKKAARSSAASVARPREILAEADGTYFLKLIVVVILGTLWLKFAQPLSWQGIPLGGAPLGMVVGLLGIRLLEKNLVDRKIWYAVLVVVTIICYFVPAGIVI